jgi:transcriptional regulator with XRE-family HTH domain
MSVELDHVLEALGLRLKQERERAGLSQDAVGLSLGMKLPYGHALVSRLEKGKIRGVRFATVVRYLQACKAPVGRFMLELAQSGAFGEAEKGLSPDYTDYTDGDKSSPSSSLKLKQAKRAKARLVHEKRWEREAQDAEIIARVWIEVQTAIRPLLAREHPIRRLLAPYLAGVRALYRAWKQATRGAVGRDSTADVQAEFDRIEQAGVRALVPAAVRKMREVVFERLMTPQSGKT